MPSFSQLPSPAYPPLTGERAELLGCPKRTCCVMGLVEAMARGTSTSPGCSGAKLGCSLLFCPLCLAETSLIHSSAEQTSVPVGLLQVVLPSRCQGMHCKGRKMLTQRRGMSLLSLSHRVTGQRNIFILKSGACFPTMFMEKSQYLLTKLLHLFPFGV